MELKIQTFQTLVFWKKKLEDISHSSKDQKARAINKLILR